MVENGSGRLRLKTRLPPVQHECGIERRGVQCRGNATPQDHRPGAGSVSQADIGRKRNGYEHGGILQHSSDTVAKAIVASVTEEEGIVLVLPESFLRVLWRYSASALTVTGSAGSAVAGEGLALEELFAVPYMSGTRFRLLSGTKKATKQTKPALLSNILFILSLSELYIPGY
jgi:hypothetical protein